MRWLQRGNKEKEGKYKGGEGSRPFYADSKGNGHREKDLKLGGGYRPVQHIVRHIHKMFKRMWR